MPEKCHICETGWETGDLQFVGIMPDGEEIWVHADDCAYALEKVIECFGDGGWMTLEEYDAAEQCVHTDPPSALVSTADSTNTAGG